jgi:hypothetical protein
MDSQLSMIKRVIGDAVNIPRDADRSTSMLVQEHAEASLLE